jgi:hypothetical protein
MMQKTYDVNNIDVQIKNPGTRSKLTNKFVILSSEVQYLLTAE